MAFGFPAYHTERYSSQAATSEELRLVVREVLRTLTWPIKSETGNRIEASSSIGLKSWGEAIHIELLPDNAIRITSKCKLPTQCFDWGKNRENVSRFLSEIEKRCRSGSVNAV